MKIVVLIFVCIYQLSGQNNDWQTYYEKSGFKETSRYDETIEFCKRLAKASAMIHYTTFGKSPQGRDLPLLIIDKNGNKTPELVRQGNNVVFLIQAGIHSGEIDGKDAGFMLIRDLVILRNNIKLLDHLTILFMPIFNVDGHERFSPYSRINQNGPEEMGWRTTAQNYNLNRDYLKVDSPEMKAWLKLYNKWLPEFFADCHVTDGADFQYAITYDIELHKAQDKHIVDWVENSYLPTLKMGMQKTGFPIIKYVDFKKGHDPKSGLESWISKPRYSTGYTTLQNRPGLLIETHMLKDYKTRVDATYQILKQTIEILNRDYLKLKKKTIFADAATKDAAFRENLFPLSFKEINDSVLVDFLGYEYSVEKSGLTGGDWFKYSKKKASWKVAFYDSFETNISTQLPAAYIIPGEWTNVIERIKLHGIDFKVLQTDQIINVKSYEFENEKWSTRPYENHHTVTFDQKEIAEKRVYLAGSIVIPMNQRRAKLVAHILEPKAPDSFLFWGFFDSIFEVKEYAESYVMEEYARIMLSSDENLKKEFERKITSDTEFASSPKEILLWFFKHSPYWDKRINKYPVGKIFERTVLEKL